MFFDILKVTGEVPRPFIGRPQNAQVELRVGQPCGGIQVTSERTIVGVDQAGCTVSIAGGERKKSAPLWPGDRIRLVDDHRLTLTFPKGQLILKPIGVSDAPKSNPEVDQIAIPSEPSSALREGDIQITIE